MWKQFLSKLPRKSSKSDDVSDASHGHTSSNNAASGNASHRAGNVNATSSRSTGAKRMSSAVFPSSVVAGIEPLVSFKDVSNAEKQNLFISKLNLCCTVFDFSDPNTSSAEKDMKRQTLLDLIDYVNACGSRFTEPIISASCKMFSINLFRVFPPNCRTGSGGGETEEDEPMFDPSWFHLQLVYDLLLKFISSSSLSTMGSRNGCYMRIM